MRLTESQLRKTIRRLLVTELFVSPKKNKKADILKRVFDREGEWGSYGDPQGGTSYSGFGEFDHEEDASGHAHAAIAHIHDLASSAGVELDITAGDHEDEGDLSSSWDGDELEDPQVDYGSKLRRPDHGDF